MSDTLENPLPGESLAADTSLVHPDGTPFQYSLEQLETMAAALQKIPDFGRNVSRRAVLGFGAAMATNIALHFVEKPIMDNHYGTHDTTVMIPQPFQTPAPSRMAGLVSPGWGGTNGKNLVTTIRDHDLYHPTFTLGYYHFSSNVTTESIEQNGLLYANTLGLRELDVHGVSEGGMIALTGALKAGRHLRLITTNDSPFDIDDAQHAIWAKAIALANEMHLYHGGLMGKFAVCLVEEADKQGWRKLFTGWGEALHSTWYGADPRMMDSQMVFMYEANLHGQRRKFRKIIDNDSVAVIMKTKQTSTDKVTKDNQSTEKWVDWYDYLHARSIVVEVDKPGHANPSAGMAAAAPHVRPITFATR